MRELTRPLHIPAPAIIATAFLSAALLFSIGSVVSPRQVMGGTITRVSACDGVSLRTKASRAAPVKASLHAGARVTVATIVTGGGWSVRCPGSVSGSKWYRISAVNGRSVKSLYGVTYVYGATGLFTYPKPSVIYRKSACDGVSLRTSASLAATRKVILKAGVKVSIDATMTGGSYSTTCQGAVAGSSWYRITAVNGTSVKSLYGVSYVYGGSRLFTYLATTIVSPTPTPTPKPTATPTPKPTATPTPSPTPTVVPGSTPAPTATPAPTPPPPGPTLTEGIDVSHWQGTIDWVKVRAAGKRFAYIKASDDIDFVDDQYVINRTNARAAGLYVGAYHFARPDLTPGDAQAEADHFVATAQFAKGDLLPVLDLETTGGLTSTALQAWVQAFLDRVYTATGVRGVIYVSPSFWSTKVGNSSWFAANGYQVLWIAHWTTAGAPTVPAGNWGNFGWTFWQYTSDGSVPGIGGRVDLDHYKGTNFTKVLIP